MKTKSKTMATKTVSGTEEHNGSGANASQNKNKKNGKDLHALLESGLKDIHSAEKQLVEALPEVIQALDSDELEEAVNEHLEQTKKHVTRLEKVMERLRISTESAKTCEAMKGLVEEARQTIREFDRGPVRDSALIIGAQKIEHYEIAVYGSLCELADVLGEDRICDLLEKSLIEEKQTDEKLSDIAQDINDEAFEMARSEKA
jgi:ferritin-like metal-binding protein YciE